MSSSTRFHELFVNYAVNLTGDYERRISELESELKKTKAVIDHLSIDCDHDICIDGGYRDSYISGDVDAELYINCPGETGMCMLSDFSVDDMSLCNQCGEIYPSISSHQCVVSDSE